MTKFLLTVTVAICCAFSSLPALHAESPSIKSSKLIWDPEQTSSPETREEVKAFEQRIKRITEKVMPATVGLLLGGGAGSGVIVSEDGLILTAAHVISHIPPGGSLQITLNDGTLVPAKALGYNPKVDSGMVRITGKPPKDANWPGAKEGKWPVADVGRSDDLKKGQWLIILGQHGGPQKDRTPPLRLARFDNLSKSSCALFTQSTMVGGDSGGPLFDLDGRVVGINSRVNGMFLEMSIHVPIQAFRDEWDKLVAGELIRAEKKVRIGVMLAPKEQKPTIADVVKDGPAEKSGMKTGDVLVKINGKSVETLEEAAAEIAKLQPEKSVEFEVKRGDETVKLSIVPEGPTENSKPKKSDSKEPNEKPNPKKSESKEPSENKN